MAIYHLEAKIVSRGAGRSAVAAAAYLSCSRMLNEYDGVQHDYTRKQGLGWRQVFLPATAPAEWPDRETLWNAVEETETAKDSRLARVVVLHPVILVEHPGTAQIGRSSYGGASSSTADYFEMCIRDRTRTSHRRF